MLVDCSSDGVFLASLEAEKLKKRERVHFFESSMARLFYIKQKYRVMSACG